LRKVSKQIQLQGIRALFMPLNKKTIKAHVHCNDFDGRGHWVGSHGDWMALVMDNGLLKIHHMYRDVLLISHYWLILEFCLRIQHARFRTSSVSYSL
jgi:hypothetical protein